MITDILDLGERRFPQGQSLEVGSGIAGAEVSLASTSK